MTKKLKKVKKNRCSFVNLQISIFFIFVCLFFFFDWGGGGGGTQTVILTKKFKSNLKYALQNRPKKVNNYDKLPDFEKISKFSPL